MALTRPGVAGDGSLGQLRRAGRDRPLNVAEGDVAYDGWLFCRGGRRQSVAGRRWTCCHVDGAGDVVQDQVRKGDVLMTRAGIHLELDGAAVDLVEQAVGDSDVLR